MREFAASYSPRADAIRNHFARAFAAGRGARPGIVAVLCFLLLAALLPQTASAAGQEFLQLREDDFFVNIDSRWAGTAYGGYYPVRIRVLNKGPTRDLLFRYSGQNAVPTVERHLTIEQNATVQFTLSIPMVSTGSAGVLQAYHANRELVNMRKRLGLPDAAPTEPPRPAILVISDTLVDRSTLEATITAQITSGASPSPGYGGYGPSYRSEDNVQLPPNMLPDSWIDYTGIDVIALPLATLEKLPSAVREAIRIWAECGGNLVVYEVGTRAAESAELARHLALTPAGNSEWSRNFDGNFESRPLRLGTLYAFQDNPFPGSSLSWTAWFKSIPDDQQIFHTRAGVSSRHASGDFLSFLIPGVGGVPVYSFLALITIFTVVIGPLNYFVLWKRKRLYLLVVTIPVIALFTSGTLFAYAMVADGFGIKSRIVSYTHVDQASRTAVSLNRVALYAGMAPSSGLEFSANTAFLPVWRDSDTTQGARVDWTNNTQHLTSGWIRSRTLTQFVTIAHRIERGRLEVESAGDTLHASNGFEWPLTVLFVTDANGKLYECGALPPGAKGTLTPRSADSLARTFETALATQPFAPPVGVDINHNYGRHGYYGYGMNPVLSPFSKSLLQKNLSRWGGSTSNPLPPRSYVAIVETNPGTEIGVKRASVLSQLHVLHGTY